MLVQVLVLSSSFDKFLSAVAEGRPFKAWLNHRPYAEAETTAVLIDLAEYDITDVRSILSARSDDVYYYDCTVAPKVKRVEHTEERRLDLE